MKPSKPPAAPATSQSITAQGHGRLSFRDYDDHTILYIRLARVLRHRIRVGVWKPGEQIPTIPELCTEFGASRAPVRQAIALLIEERLLASTRGRGTFVLSDTAPYTDEAVTLSISDPLADYQTIKILARKTVEGLPDELRGNYGSDAPYVWIEKVHYHEDQPFAAMQVFVAEHLYARIPKRLEVKSKIGVLIRKYANANPVKYRQEIAIAHATGEVARQLEVQLGSVLVRIRRWWLDVHDRPSWASVGFYRADTFIHDVTISNDHGQLFNIVSGSTARDSPAAASLTRSGAKRTGAPKPPR